MDDLIEIDYGEEGNAVLMELLSESLEEHVLELDTPIEQGLLKVEHREETR